jgi:hypothetical protein
MVIMFIIRQLLLRFLALRGCLDTRYWGSAGMRPDPDQMLGKEQAADGARVDGSRISQ